MSIILCNDLFTLLLMYKPIYCSIIHVVFNLKQNVKFHTFKQLQRTFKSITIKIGICQYK